MSRYGELKTTQIHKCKRKIEILETKMKTIFERDVITDNMMLLYNSYEAEWKVLQNELLQLNKLKNY